MYRFAATAGVIVFALATAPTAVAQTPQASTEPPMVHMAEAGKWAPMPDLMPKGAEMMALHGDPAKGAADFYFRVPANYTFPWHFHTPIEKLFVDQGTLSYEARGEKKHTLDAGDYVYVPARSPHRVTCTGSMECRSSHPTARSTSTWWTRCGRRRRAGRRTAPWPRPGSGRQSRDIPSTGAGRESRARPPQPVAFASPSPRNRARRSPRSNVSAPTPATSTV